MKKNCQEGRYRRKFLLLAPMSGLSGNKKKRNRAKVSLMLSELGELSCKACVMGIKANTLIDTGASVSLLSSEIMNKLEDKPALAEAHLVIKQADGSQMEIEGKILSPVEVVGCRSKSHLICGSRIVCRTNLRGRLVEG